MCDMCDSCTTEYGSTCARTASIRFEVSDRWGSLVCLKVTGCFGLVLVMSHGWVMNLLNPLELNLIRVPSLQIQLHSCGFNHSSGFSSLVGAWVKT